MNSRLSRIGSIVCLLFVMSFPAHAQDNGMVDYSDETAVGTVDYSDEEAAGTIVDTPPADANTPVGDTSAVDATGEQDADAADGVEGTSESEFSGEGSENWDIETTAALPDSEEKADEEKKMWEWGAQRHHMSASGSSGLLTLTEAGSGPVSSFGLGLSTGFFKYRDYLINGDTHKHMSGKLNLRITPIKYLEIHTGLKAAANYNDQEFPNLFQTIGDFDLGVKGFFSPVDWITLGLDLSVYLYNSIGDVGIDWGATTVGINGLATFNIAKINNKAPLRFHIVAGYMIDNSSNLVDDIEAANGGCGTDLDGNGQVEFEGCLTPVERTSLGIDRNDQVHLGFGIDALLPYVSPILEYKMEIPINRQDFICPQNVPGSYDTCMLNAGGKGMRQSLALGVRILPPLENLAIDLGVDIGLTGYAPSVHELAAQAPYKVLMGLSYSFSYAKKEAPVCDTPVVPVAATEPVPEVVPMAYIVGLVKGEGVDGAPIKNAIITYGSDDLAPQATGEDGSFNSYELPAGSIGFTIEAPDYEPGSFTVEMPVTGVVEQEFILKPIPKKAELTVTVSDENEKPIVGVKINIKGLEPLSGVTDDAGIATFETEPGELEVSTEAEGYLSKVAKVTAEFGTHTKIPMQLRDKPKNSLVVVAAKRIRIKRKIRFAVNSDEIDPKSFNLMDQIVDTLINNPQITQIEIQGHTDDRGKKDYNISLSERRARSVMQYLIDGGIAASRLSAKGFGPRKPIAPNVTSNGRSRNRRVEFHVLDKTE